MSLIHNIDHLFAAPGVSAISISEDPRLPSQFRGLPYWEPVLTSALDCRLKVSEESIRLIVGEHTIYVQREAGQVAAIVVPTGHAICKSLRRMIRRCARAEGHKSDRAAKVDAAINPEPEPEPDGAEVLDAAAAFGT